MAETAQGTKGVLGSENHVKRRCELPDSALTTVRARPPTGIVKSPLVASAKKHTTILSRVLRPGGQGTINNFVWLLVNFGTEHNVEGFVSAVQSPWWKIGLLLMMAKSPFSAYLD